MKVRKKRTKEQGNCARKESSKEIDMKVCKKSINEIGECVRKKSSTELGK